MKHVVIIPGFGNFVWLYRLALYPWQWRGYKTSVHSFDWMHDDGDFAGRFAKLLAYVDTLPANDKIYLLGASAGGPVALLALLARPGKIMRIATIASPLFYTGDPVSNTIFNNCMRALRPQLPLIDSSISQGVITLFGQADQIVAPKHSRITGALAVQMSTGHHVSAVVVGLTLYAGRIHEFFGS